METFSAFTGLRRIPLTKGQWRGALMFSLICARINAWENNSEAHYDVTVMLRLPKALNGLSIRLYPGDHFDRCNNWLTYSLLSFPSQNSTGNKTGHFKNVAKGLKCYISHSNMDSQSKHVRTDPHPRVLIFDFNIFVHVRQSKYCRPDINSSESLRKPHSASPISISKQSCDWTGPASGGICDQHRIMCGSTCLYVPAGYTGRSRWRDNMPAVVCRAGV